MQRWGNLEEQQRNTLYVFNTGRGIGGKQRPNKKRKFWGKKKKRTEEMNIIDAIFFSCS